MRSMGKRYFAIDAREVSRKRWSTEEDELLTQVYSTEGLYAAVEALKSRTAAGVEYRAARLGLQKPADKRHYARWSPEEDSTLQTYYPAEGIRVMKRIPGRTRASVINRVNHYGLRRKFP